MDPTARYNRLREAYQELQNIDTDLKALLKGDNVVLLSLSNAIGNLAINVYNAYEATLPKTKESKP